LKDRIVARALSLETELPPCNPNQRMKPIERADKVRQDVQRPVAATDVFQLVHQSSPNFGLAPLARIGRHENRRMQQAACDRRNDRVMEKNYS